MAVRDRGGGAEGPGEAGVAPTASLNGMRRSEKAKVLENRGNCKGREHVQGTCMREDGARGPWPSDQILIEWGAWNLGCFVYYFLWVC